MLHCLPCVLCVLKSPDSLSSLYLSLLSFHIKVLNNILNVSTCFRWLHYILWVFTSLGSFFSLCSCPPPIYKTLLSNILAEYHRFPITLIYLVSVEISSHSFLSLSSSDIYSQKPVKYHIYRSKLFTCLHYVLWTHNSLWPSFVSRSPRNDYHHFWLIQAQHGKPISRPLILQWI